MTTTSDPIAALAAAEADALAAHFAGTCRDSEWSCSHCEAVEEWQRRHPEAPKNYEEPEDESIRASLDLQPIAVNQNGPHPDNRPCPSWCGVGAAGVQIDHCRVVDADGKVTEPPNLYLEAGTSTIQIPLAEVPALAQALLDAVREHSQE